MERDKSAECIVRKCCLNEEGFSEFNTGCIAFPHVIFHSPEVCLTMRNPEDRNPGILRAVFQKILNPGPVGKEPLLQGFVFKKLNVPANPHHFPGSLYTRCIETKLHFWVFP